MRWLRNKYGDPVTAHSVAPGATANCLETAQSSEARGDYVVGFSIASHRNDGFVEEPQVLLTPDEAAQLISDLSTWVRGCVSHGYRLKKDGL